MEGYSFFRDKDIVTPGLNLASDSAHFCLKRDEKVCSCLEGVTERIRNAFYVMKPDGTHSVFPFAGKKFQSFKYIKMYPSGTECLVKHCIAIGGASQGQDLVTFHFR